MSSQTTRLCTVEGCNSPHYAHNLCRAHYLQSYKFGKRCRVEGCLKPYSSRGYCAMHFRRVRLHGDPLIGGRLSPEERFWSRIDPCRTDACYEWMGQKDREGYGRIGLNGSYIMTHYFLAGRPPDGLEWDHLCSRRSCANPDHLEAVTHHLNLLRGAGWGAKNARRTHCIRGHEFSLENTRLTKDGRRVCRECARAESFNRYRRTKALMAEGS